MQNITYAKRLAARQIATACVQYPQSGSAQLLPRPAACGEPKEPGNFILSLSITAAGCQDPNDRCRRRILANAADYMCPINRLRHSSRHAESLARYYSCCSATTTAATMRQRLFLVAQPAASTSSIPTQPRTPPSQPCVRPSSVLCQTQAKPLASSPLVLLQPL